MAQFHWDPENYLGLMREEVPDYDRLQAETAAATADGASRALELGTGTGETARTVLVRHPAATLIGIDASADMLARARLVLPAHRVRLEVARLEDPLPAGPFDLVFSALAIHHLEGPGKAELFRRVAAVLAPGGRFVMGDVVVPEDPGDAVVPIDGEYDTPSRLADLVRWFGQANLRSTVAWAHRDLAVLVGTAPGPVSRF